jgi:D-glycero-D-manno-heptose 1,7-bisphosphate phosphatase
MRKAVFLDKDGVINALIPREDGRLTSPWTLEEFKDSIYLHVKESIQILRNLDYMVLVVTNQPGVLDGDMYMTELDDICGYLEDEYGVNHVLYALKQGTPVYKPNNGMMEALIRTYHIDRSKSFMVGDRWKDIVPGNKSDLTTIYVGEGEYNPPEEYRNDSRPDYTALNLRDAVRLIESIGEK